jgi:hypothetical protein
MHVFESLIQRPLGGLLNSRALQDLKHTCHDDHFHRQTRTALPNGVGGFKDGLGDLRLVAFCFLDRALKLSSSALR